jgi:hypothetical protein
VISLWSTNPNLTLTQCAQVRVPVSLTPFRTCGKFAWTTAVTSCGTVRCGLDYVKGIAGFFADL